MAGGIGVRIDKLRPRRLASRLSIEALARFTNTSDLLVNQLESGGNCDPEDSERMKAAFTQSVAVTSSSVANPTVVTAATNTFLTGDTVTITGHSGSTPAIDGTHIVTVLSATTFTIPVNVTVGGTGGTAAWDPVSLGIARL